MISGRRVPAGPLAQLRMRRRTAELIDRAAWKHTAGHLLSEWTRFLRGGE